MNKKISEWYVRNKYKINLLVIIVIGLIVINLLLVYLSSKNSQNKNENVNTYVEKNNIENKYNSIASEEESALTGDKIDEHKNIHLETINKFMEYCKGKKIEEAYSLLSDECKEAFYHDIETFKISYYDLVFDNNDKNISVQNWNDNIYKVEISNNALSTGIYDQNSIKQDYITVVGNENNEPRLNINGYIGRTEINKVSIGNNLDIEVIETDKYMNYQTYTFKVTNKTDNNILLDDKLSNESMYIEDNNQIKYTSYMHEISEEELVVTPKSTKSITIKYYNRYGSTKKIKKVAFSKIVLNYNENATKKYESIIIDL